MPKQFTILHSIAGLLYDLFSIRKNGICRMSLSLVKRLVYNDASILPLHYSAWWFFFYHWYTMDGRVDWLCNDRGMDAISNEWQTNEDFIWILIIWISIHYNPATGLPISEWMWISVWIHMVTQTIWWMNLHLYDLFNMMMKNGKNWWWLLVSSTLTLQMTVNRS